MAGGALWKVPGPGRCAYVERGMSIPLLGLIGGDPQLTECFEHVRFYFRDVRGSPYVFRWSPTRFRNRDRH